MEISFRYTDAEYKETKLINKLLPPAPWRLMLLLVFSLIPSAAIAIWMFSLIGFLAFVCVGIGLLTVLFGSLRQQPNPKDPFDHHLTIDADSFVEEYSNSEFGARWEYFDKLIESESDVLLQKESRHFVFPKRIFSPEQLPQILQHAQQAGKPLEGGMPIALYTRHFSDPNAKHYHRFSYAGDDLRKAFSRNLQPVETSIENKPTPKSPNRLIRIIWMTLVGLSIGTLLTMPYYGQPAITSVQLFSLGAIFFLPPALVWIGAKVSRHFMLKKLPQTPTTPLELMISPAGFACGSPINVSFYNWKDIVAFHQNVHCIGFKTVNDVIHIIPKRAFANGFAADDFLNQSVLYYRESHRDEIPIAIPVETGNPYQPPA